MKLRRLRIRHFRCLRDVVFDDIPALSVLVGANGSGKSTVLDALAFMRDVVTGQGRWNPEDLLSRESQQKSLSFEIDYVEEEGKTENLYRYSFSIEFTPQGEATFVEESLVASDGKDLIFKRDFSPEHGPVLMRIQKGAIQRLMLHRGVSGLFLLRASADPDAEKIYDALSHFYHIDIRLRPGFPAEGRGPITHRLMSTGANAHAVARYLFEHHPEVFRLVERRMTQRIPGLKGIDPFRMEDGRIALRFEEGAIQTPFLERDVSAGTLDMLAWLLALNDPDPPSLLCAEEPEGQINPHFLGELAEDFELFSEQKGQVFVTTQSPDFLNAVPLDSVWVLEKRDGETKVLRARDNPTAQAMGEEGDLPGWIWMSGAFRGAP